MPNHYNPEPLSGGEAEYHRQQSTIERLQDELAAADARVVELEGKHAVQVDRLMREKHERADSALDAECRARRAEARADAAEAKCKKLEELLSACTNHVSAEQVFGKLHGRIEELEARLAARDAADAELAEMLERTAEKTKEESRP